MDTALWIVQGLLAVAFGMAGMMKMTQPREKMQEKMAFVEDFSDNQMRGIGLLEVLGAVGMILPMALEILEIMTPLAALGLVLTMIGAAYTHYRRDEMSMIGPNVVLLAMAAFVLIGRLLMESTKVV